MHSRVEWTEVLKEGDASRDLMDQIVDQIPKQARGAFEGILNKLAQYHTPEVDDKLSKLDALEDADVENDWGGYEDAMKDAGLMPEDDDDDGDDSDED